VRPTQKILLAIMLLAILLTQPSCWDQREVERLGIVLATGVDLAPDGKVRIIVQNINSQSMGRGMGGGGGGGGVLSKAYRNRSIDGETIFDAIRKLSRETPRQLFFAHNQVILVSERLARERGLAEILDFFERNPQVRRTTWLLVGKGDMAALLDEPGRLENTPAQRMVSIINERNLNSQFAVLRLGDFIELLESKSTQPFTAVIESVNNPALPGTAGSRLQEGAVQEPSHTYFFSSTAIFRGDRLVGFFPPTESRGLLWIRGEVKGGIINIPIPGQENSRVAVEIASSKTKLQPEIRDERIFMPVEVKVESNLGETTAPLDLTRPETVKKLEELTASVVSREIEAALAKAQGEYKVDVFGFGEALHRKFPGEWKTMQNQWIQLFPTVQVPIRVEVKIRRTGMTTKPLGQR
jgi:spore germination protein KC